MFGDGPADVVGAAMDAIAAGSRERGDALPSGEDVLRAFVAALGLDGTLAPFYGEPKHVSSMTVHHGGRAVHVDATGAKPWIIAELFDMLELVAEEYQDSWDRPPSLAELVAYLKIYFEEEETLAEHLSDTRPWKLAPATFTFGKRKPKDRREPPKAATPTRSSRRVKHPKFGEGDVVSEEGDHLTIEFRDARRVLLRKFVQPL